MIRKFVLGSAITLLALAGTAGAAAASPAHPASPVHPASASALSAPCHTVEVMLHGNGKPASKCLAGSGSVTPNTATPACHDPTIDDQKFLDVYLNGPIDPPSNIIPTGLVLCVYGQGDLSLSNGDIGGVNWNDKASAWWAGCSGGIFYQDSVGGHGSGFQETFQGGPDGNQPFGNFDGQNGDLPNDSLSAIHISNNC
jgi:hypothetical protein